ncbi:M1 family aminopeptidase [Salinarimonas sp.]|uniref:M1 family metallopeptidase n=1 Tax=Salinarimonas sp. TaxID=2766526 RepID=UPI0032D98DD2
MRFLQGVAAFLAVSVAGLVATQPAHAAAEHAVTLRLDPETGALALSDVVTGADAALVLDGADWLETLAAQAGDAAIAPEDGRLVVPAARAAADPVTITAEGVLPPVDGALAAAGASPEGAFLLDPSGWLPRSADGGDAYTLTVETPAPWRAVATGALVSEEEAGDVRRATFRFAPHDEPPVVLAGPWIVDERDVAGLRLRTYFPEAARDYAPAYLDAAQVFLARFAEEIGPYPYDGFAIVAAPIPVGLGFPNLTYVAQSILAHPYMRGRSLAHEILHSWWGNAVGLEAGAGNWAEGLTTYQADYALAADESPEAAKALRREWLADLAALPADARTPIVDFRSSGHDGQAVGYGKLALVFRMLEQELGEADFRSGLRTLYERHRFGRAGWPEVRAAFEAAADRDLGWFFGQWLERAGEPRVILADAAPLADGTGVSLTLAQDAPAYRLSVPVRIETAAGPVETIVRLDAETRTFRLETPAAPDAVHVDPDFGVVRALLDGETAPALRDVLRADDLTLVAPSPALPFAEAQALVRRLVGADAALDAASAPPDAPAIVVGLTADVARLAAEGAPARAGEARAWIAREGPPRLHLSADTPDALADLVGRLRFYAKESLVVVADGEAVRRETWETGASPLTRRF